MKTSLALALASIALVAPLHAVTRYIAPGTNRSAAVQTAVDASVSGDVIVLQAGVHYFPGKVTVTISGLTIRGETGTIIHKSNTTQIPAFEIDGSSNIISDFELDGSTKPGSGINCFGDSNSFNNLVIHNCGNAGRQRR